MSERFRIDSRVRQGYIISPCLFNVYMEGDGKDGSEIHGADERMEIT